MIIEYIDRPPAEIVQGFRELLAHDSITCAISDCMGRFNAMTSDMRPLFEGIRATIGELVNVDQVFRTTFSYQNKALE